MKRVDAAAFVWLALGSLVLTGCADVPWLADPFDISGRDGSIRPPSYAALMRIGAAAHAGGDLATAVGVYRRAAALNPSEPAALVAVGNTLLEMGNVNEAIVAYQGALARNELDGEALRGLARAFLTSGKPELAGEPLALAYKASPDDPKLLQLIGVGDDLVGQHEEAQARYRRALELMPGDRALSLNLALSLALVGNYPEAIVILRPIAHAEHSSPRERQTLALIYGLAGDRRAAEQIARRDLDAASVQQNLAYYDTLRALSPEARQRAIRSLGAQERPDQPS